MPYTEMNNTWDKLFLISEHAKREPQLQFTSLAHLLNRDFLQDCYNSLNRNKAVGIDGVCWKEYGEKLDDNVEVLITRMKHKRYKPMPARRVYIPKNESEKRPLGISALENKIVELGITRILRSIYRRGFSGVFIRISSKAKLSSGYRQSRQADNDQTGQSYCGG